MILIIKYVNLVCERGRSICSIILSSLLISVPAPAPGSLSVNSPTPPRFLGSLDVLPVPPHFIFMVRARVARYTKSNSSQSEKLPILAASISLPQNNLKNILRLNFFRASRVRPPPPPERGHVGRYMQKG